MERDEKRYLEMAERGRNFYALMREKRKMKATLVDSDGNRLEFDSRQDAGRFLAEKYNRTVHHCTLVLRNTGKFKDYTLEK